MELGGGGGVAPRIFEIAIFGPKNQVIFGENHLIYVGKNIRARDFSPRMKLVPYVQNYCIPGCLLIHLNIIQRRHQNSTILKIEPPQLSIGL